IVGHFGATYRNLRLEYAVEEFPLGTGGAIALSMEKTTASSIFVLNGDTYFPVSLERLARKHDETEADITLALKALDNFDRYGNVLLRGSQIMAFEEK